MHKYYIKARFEDSNAFKHYLTTFEAEGLDSLWYVSSHLSSYIILPFYINCKLWWSKFPNKKVSRFLAWKLGLSTISLWSKKWATTVVSFFNNGIENASNCPVVYKKLTRGTLMCRGMCYLGGPTYGLSSHFTTSYVRLPYVNLYTKMHTYCRNLRI